MNNWQNALFALILGCAGCLTPVHALNDGLALTPPMGWNPWTCLKFDVNDAIFKEVADSMVSRGFLDAGYIFMNQDGGGRYSNQKALADYVKAKGFKFGVYGNNVNYTTPVSNWVANWVAWGADYVKWDCYRSPTQDTIFKSMRDAIKASGRLMVYSAHGKPYGVTSAHTDITHMWRTGPDIMQPGQNPNDWNWIFANINYNNAYAQHVKPGYWNDPDFLVVGVHESKWYSPGVPSFTWDEYRTMMNLYCVMAAPLILAGDPRRFSKQSMDILLNKEVIAVNQDSLGHGGRRVKTYPDSGEVWMKNLKNGDRALVLFNRSAKPLTVAVKWSDIGMGGPVFVRDLWEHADKGFFADSFTMQNLPPHGSGMIRVKGQAISSVIAPERAQGLRVHSTSWRIANVNTNKSYHSAPIFNLLGQDVAPRMPRTASGQLPALLLIERNAQ